MVPAMCFWPCCKAASTDPFDIWEIDDATGTVVARLDGTQGVQPTSADANRGPVRMRVDSAGRLVAGYYRQFQLIQADANLAGVSWSANPFQSILGLTTNGMAVGGSDQAYCQDRLVFTPFTLGLARTDSLGTINGQPWATYNVGAGSGTNVGHDLESDASDNVYLGMSPYGSPLVHAMNSAGGAIWTHNSAATGYSPLGIQPTYRIALDATAGVLWADFGTLLTGLDPATGTPTVLTPTNTPSTGSTGVNTAIAVDETTGDVWITRSGQVDRYSASGAFQLSIATTTGSLPSQIAADGGYVYVPHGNGVSKYDTSGALQWAQVHTQPTTAVVVRGGRVYASGTRILAP